MVNWGKNPNLRVVRRKKGDFSVQRGESILGVFDTYNEAEQRKLVLERR